MEREKLVKTPRIRLDVRKGAVDPFDEMADSYDKRHIGRLNVRIEELEHEIRTVQASAGNLVRRAEQEAAKKVRAELVRNYEFRIIELEAENAKLARNLARIGDEVACPECGVVSPLKLFLKAD